MLLFDYLSLFLNSDSYSFDKRGISGMTLLMLNSSLKTNFVFLFDDSFFNGLVIVLLSLIDNPSFSPY